MLAVDCFGPLFFYFLLAFAVEVWLLPEAYACFAIAAFSASRLSRAEECALIFFWDGCDSFSSLALAFFLKLKSENCPDYPLGPFALAWESFNCIVLDPAPYTPESLGPQGGSV